MGPMLTSAKFTTHNYDNHLYIYPQQVELLLHPSDCLMPPAPHLTISDISKVQAASLIVTWPLEAFVRSENKL